MRGYIITSLIKLLARLSLTQIHQLGELIGRALALCPNETRRVTQINIQHCFPDLPTDEQLALLKRSLLETGKTITEAGPLWLWPPSRTLHYIKDVHGTETLTTQLDEGKGAIIVSPHLGAWEVAGLYTASLGPMTTLYRPPKLAALNKIVQRGRQGTGAKLVPTNQKGVRALFSALNNKELVGILPDQDPGQGNGVFAPFFGIKANTMTLLLKIAQRTGAPVFLLWAQRLQKGKGYEIHIKRIDERINQLSLDGAAAVLNSAIEQIIREKPEQYLWAYKRFKTRPPGEKPFYS